MMFPIDWWILHHFSAGYAIRDLLAVELDGWELRAITTAYIRVLGKSIGTDTFLGPMAKPHRMALITVSALLEIAAIHFDFGFSPIYYSLMILNVDVPSLAGDDCIHPENTDG